MKKQLLKSALIALAGVGLLSGSALADPYLYGSISMSGSAQIITASSTVDFLTVGDVDIVKGAFATLVSTSDYATMFDFSYASPFSLSKIWEVNGISFFLTSVTATVTDDISLEGTGYTLAAGYEKTYGTWKLTGQDIADEFSWSSNLKAVPEPGTMLLFGTGLAGFASIARRKKN